MGILNSMNIFLRQEIDRMQLVIGLVRKTLKDLLLAIEGTIIMNEVRLLKTFSRNTAKCTIYLFQLLLERNIITVITFISSHFIFRL